MEEEIRNIIKAYSKSYYQNDFEKMISFFDGRDLDKYVQDFKSFASKMDEFGESDDFLRTIGVADLDTLRLLTTIEFMEKILALTKVDVDVDVDSLIKNVESIKITSLEFDNNIANVKYTVPFKQYGLNEIIESSLKLSKQANGWRIHFKSGMDRLLAYYQKEIDTYNERKGQDQLQNLNHHVNDLEKTTLIGYKNMNGDMVFEPRFKDGGDFSEGLAYVKVMTKYGFIDKTGELVIKPQYKEVSDFSEGLAAVQISKTDKWGFINLKGKEVIRFTFDEVTDFSEGLCAVSINYKWGYINKEGVIVIPIQYEEASPFMHDETALVEIIGNEENESFYINKKGEIIAKEE